MKKLFLNTIQEVENLKNLLHSNQISYRYLKMKRQYLFNYPSELEEKIVELGYLSFSHSHNELTTNLLFSSLGIMALFKKLNSFQDVENTSFFDKIGIVSFETTCN